MTAATDRTAGTPSQGAEITSAGSNDPAGRFGAGAAAHEMKYVRLQSG
ncbi:MAG: hypothetical protein WBC15_02145 [Mycobacterium sp.]